MELFSIRIQRTFQLVSTPKGMRGVFSPATVEYGFYLFHSMFVKLHASNNSLVFAQ